MRRPSTKRTPLRLSVRFALLLGLLLVLAAAGAARAETALPATEPVVQSDPATAPTGTDPASESPTPVTDPTGDPGTTPAGETPPPVTGTEPGTTPSGTTPPPVTDPVPVGPAPVPVEPAPAPPLAEEPVPAPVEAAPALPERPDAPPTAARPDRAPDEGADAGPLTLPQAAPTPARVLAIGGPDAAAPSLGRPDAYAPPAGGPDAPAAATRPAPAPRAERPDAAPPARLDALLGARAGDPLGPAGAPARAAAGADLAQRLSSTSGARGDEGTRVTALGEAALLDVSLPGGSGQSAGASLLQLLAGYLIPPGGAPNHLMLVVELALLGLLCAALLPRGAMLRLLARAGAVHAGYRAVALRPG